MNSDNTIGNATANRLLKSDEMTNLLRKGTTNWSDSDAQIDLAIRYEKDEGVEMDLEKAVEWYQKSAKASNSNA